MLVSRGRRGLFGLGSTASKAANTGTIDPTLITGGGNAGAYAPPTGPYGWTRWGFDRVKSDYEQRLMQRAAMTRMDLLHKYGPQMQEASVLYPDPYKGPDGRTGAENVCLRADYTGHVGILYPPGIVMHMGVPLPPDVITQPKIEISYVPNEEQQLLADLAIYVHSQRRISCALTRGDSDPDDSSYGGGWFRILDPVGIVASGGKRGCNDLAGNNDIWLDLAIPSRGIQRSVDKTNESIKQFRTGWNVGAEATQPPGWALDGYGHNPIAPTDDELNNPGGLKRYYARGGFLLFPDMAEGRDWIYALYSKQSAVQDGGALLGWGDGYFLCNGLPTMGMKAMSGNAGRGWMTYLTVGPTGYTMRIEANEEMFSDKVTNGLYAVVKGFWDTICANQPIANQVASDSLVKELCQDANGNSCTKGTVGCTCSKPTKTQVVAKDIWTAALGIACSAYVGSFTPKPDAPTLFTPPPPSDAIVDVKKVPWWALVGGGLLLGAGAFSFLGPTKRP